MKESPEKRIKRLLYQSWYRGCKETDRLLGVFARAEIATMNAQELDDFEAILHEEDRDIFAWLTGKAPIPERYAAGSMMQKLKAFDFSGSGV
jgi:antitoxin CptB